jgi:transposase
MERTSREAWAKRVERWQDSGLTAKEYAAEAGINAHSLSWWKWQLSSGTKARKRAPRTRQPSARPVTTSPLTFVEMTSSLVPESLEVVLPSSIRIRVPSTFDAPALGRLLDVLEHRG